MNLRNCIDVKHIIKLNILYILRFFGRAGLIKNVQKDQVTRYVTIEYQSRQSVDRALAYNGKILFKSPIKIKRSYEPPQAVPQVAQGYTRSIINLTPSIQQQAIKQKNKQEYRPVGMFQQRLWFLILDELKSMEQQQQSWLGLLIWGLGDQLIRMIRHLHFYGSNMKSSYLLVEIQKQLMKEHRVKHCTYNRVQFEVQYPNFQQQQQKIQVRSSFARCLKKINKKAPKTAAILRNLYADSLIFRRDELQDITWLAQQNMTFKEDTWCGFLHNIGIRNLCYQLLSYQRSNTCIFTHQSARPDVFCCSLRLVGCRGHALQARENCKYAQAVVWKRWSQERVQYHLQIKQQEGSVRLDQNNLFFQEEHFNIRQLSHQAQKYNKFVKNGGHCKVIYVQRHKQVNHHLSQPNILHQPHSYQQQVVLNLALITVTQHQNSPFSHLKLSHFLSDYMRQHIINNGIVIASLQVADKLAQNILQDQTTGHIYDCKLQKRQIAQMLWRMYAQQKKQFQIKQCKESNQVKQAKEHAKA